MTPEEAKNELIRYRESARLMLDASRKAKTDDDRELFITAMQKALHCCALGYCDIDTDEEEVLKLGGNPDEILASGGLIPQELKRLLD